MNILGSIQLSKYITPSPITVTPLLAEQTTRYAFGISRSGQSIVFVNTSNQIFLSTDYGANFQQKTNMLAFSCDTISVSNNGQYILSSARYGKNSGKIQLSTDSGTTWTAIWSANNANLPNLRVFSSGISATGQYMFVSGDESGSGIYVSNNFGAGAWTRPFTAGYTQGGAISESGQYIIVASNSGIGIDGPIYSSNFGVSFVSLTGNTATTYSRSAMISGNGNYVVGTSTNPNVWYCSAPAASATCTAAAITVNVMFTNIDQNGLFALNANGSECYFIDRRTTGATTRKLMVTTDNFQTATLTHNVISNLETTSHIVASSNVKYILVWNGRLNLLTNTLIE